MHSNHPLPSNQARFKVRRLNAAHSAADGAAAATLGRCVSLERSFTGTAAATRQNTLVALVVPRDRVDGTVACTVFAAYAELKTPVQSLPPAPAAGSVTLPLPNPSLERGPSNGLARVAPAVYHPPRGPSRRRSAQLKR
jgi:hypothetical protein